jgi:NAD(P)H-nitrite reductase large subunit
MPLMDGDRGSVLQRNGHTYAITPHLPCGLVTPDMLRRIADVAERYGAVLKCTGAQRIAIIGLREEDLDAAWADLGSPRPAQMTGNVIRSVRACPGTQFCKRARQDSLALGLELDRRYNGRALPGKMKIGVSGCANQCSETGIRDIGVVGGSAGWTILVGGSGGMSPRIAKELTQKSVTTEQVLQIVDRVINYYETNAQPGERMGDVIGRLGMNALRAAAGMAE